MITVVTPDAVRHVALHMRDRDYKECLALSWARNRAELAEDLAARYGSRQDVFCASLNRRPVAIGAALEIRPNVVSLLFFATGQMPRIGGSLTRFIRGQFIPSLVSGGCHRFEAVTLTGYLEASRWLRLLGLRHEATCLGYGKSGETFDMYALIRDDVRPTSH